MPRFVPLGFIVLFEATDSTFELGRIPRGSGGREAEPAARGVEPCGKPGEQEPVEWPEEIAGSIGPAEHMPERPDRARAERPDTAEAGGGEGLDIQRDRGCGGDAGGKARGERSRPLLQLSEPGINRERCRFHPRGSVPRWGFHRSHATPTMHAVSGGNAPATLHTGRRAPAVLVRTAA